MAAEFDTDAVPRIGLLWRGDPAADPYSTPGAERLGPLMAALRRLNVAAVPVIYRDDALDSVRGQLLGLDGVMVWVNPIQDGVNRAWGTSWTAARNTSPGRDPWSTSPSRSGS